MNIVKKKTRDLEVGDIMIFDWKEIESQNMDIVLQSYGSDNSAFENFKMKFEGETKVLLYEIDDIETDYLTDEEGEKHDADESYEYKSKYTLSHYHEQWFPDICINGYGDYEWDVIDNPHKLPHYIYLT